MAWRSSGSSNAELVANLWRNGVVRSPRVRDAMLAVDRACFCRDEPYADAPQPIGCGATISAPHMHAAAAEALLPALVPRPAGPRVLDIGSGSGYLSAVLSVLAGPSARVVGIEHIPSLRDLAARNAASCTPVADALGAGRLRFVVADGRRAWNDTDPSAAGDDSGWDAIHVGAAAEELHDELVAQLRSPGRMFIPLADVPGSSQQHVWIIHKDATGNVTKEKLFGVMYVPLTDAPPI